MKKIVLDTNFLMIPASLGVDIISEIDRICDFRYGIYIVDKTLKELDSIIQNQKGKHKAAAKLALGIIENNNINIIDTQDHDNADDAIVALEGEYVVATQDAGLKKRLKEKRIPLIVLRQKKYLKLEKV